MHAVLMMLLAQAAFGMPAQQKLKAAPTPSKLPPKATTIKGIDHKNFELPSMGNLPPVEDVMRFMSVSEGQSSALRAGTNASRAFASADRVNVQAMIGLSDKLLAGIGVDSNAELDRTSLEASLFEQAVTKSRAPSLAGLSAALGGGLTSPPALGGAEEAMQAILDPHASAVGSLAGPTTAQTAFDAYGAKINEGVATLRLLTTKLNREVVAANTIKDIISNYKLKFINVLKDIKDKTERMKQLKSLVQELEKAKLHQGIQDALKTAMTDLNSISARAGGHIDAEYEQIQQKLSSLASHMAKFQH